MLTCTSRRPDPEQFEAFVERYRSRVFRFALASLRDRDAADTVTQNCFFKAYRAWDQFRRECSADTWIMNIAFNLIRDHGRNRRLRFWRKACVPMPLHETAIRFRGASACSPERQLLSKERLTEVWSAVAELPNRQRAVFLLRFADEMGVLEIAAVTGLSQGTVKVHLFRAMNTIRQTFGGAEQAF